MEESLVIVACLLLIVVGFGFGFLIGMALSEETLYEHYCAYQEATYEFIQNKHSCIKDNKIEVIRWAELKMGEM